MVQQPQRSRHSYLYYDPGAASQTLLLPMYGNSAPKQVALIARPKQLDRKQGSTLMQRRGVEPGMIGQREIMGCNVGNGQLDTYIRTKVKV